MARRREVSIGDRFGRWTVLSEVAPRVLPSGQTQRTMGVRCDCGEVRAVPLLRMVRGESKSCGCLRAELVGTASVTHGKTRGGGPTSLYVRWCSLKSRTLNQNNAKYSTYGGRGITVYAPWIKDFSAFESWVVKSLGECPAGLTLGRINNDVGYFPGNLRWETAEEQASNRTTTRLVEWRGTTKPLRRWADYLGLPYRTLWHRLTVANWSVEKAFTTAVRKW